MLDYIIIGAYGLTMLMVGWFSRKQTADSYWVAGRRYGTVRITTSLAATIFGASSTIGVIGLGYIRGLTGAWWLLAGVAGLVVFGVILAGKVRQLTVYTLPDILHNAYGTRVSVPAGLMIAVAWAGVIAAQMLAGARLLSGVIPVSFSTSLTIIAVVFTLYTFWGGQLSVIRTDFWQLVFFAISIILGVVLLFGYGATDLAMWSNIPRDHLRFPVSDSFGWYDALIYYPLVVGLPYLVGPDMYSRALCAKSAEVARRAAVLAAFIIIPPAFLLVLFGILARGVLPGIPAESALPEVLRTFAPSGVRGLITVGFLGAIMSSADTCLISAATIITHNVIKPLSGLSDRNLLRSSKALVLVLGAVGWLIAESQKGIISSLLLGYTIFVGGVVFPTLATFYRDKLGITSAGAFGAVVVGGGMAIISNVSDGTIARSLLGQGGMNLIQSLLGPKALSILPILLSLFTLLIVSRLTRSSSGCQAQDRKDEKKPAI
ncbi:MAG: sodium:solute symporter family protein [candidate division Zixibacteria bacterium]|nr:sodium:solute symporter family protein [candidate division Zixibacteria bacterium]